MLNYNFSKNDLHKNLSVDNGSDKNYTLDKIENVNQRFYDV